MRVNAAGVTELGAQRSGAGQRCRAGCEVTGRAKAVRPPYSCFSCQVSVGAEHDFYMNVYHWAAEPIRATAGRMPSTTC